MRPSDGAAKADPIERQFYEDYPIRNDPQMTPSWVPGPAAFEKALSAPFRLSKTASMKN